MFSFGRREDESPTHQVLRLNLSLSSPKNGKVHPKNINGRGRNNFQPAGRRNNAGRLQRTNVHDTNDGVEVSLDFAKGGGPASPLEAREPPQVPYRPEPVISLRHQLKQRQRVHRVQFSVNFPLNPQTSSLQGLKGASFPKSPGTQGDSFWRPKDHRIPLRGTTRVDPAFEDVLNLLQHSHVSDERTAVHQELELMNLEIEALEQDKGQLQAQLNVQASSPSSAFSHSTMSFNTHTPNSVDWDVQKLLDSSRLTDASRRRLEALRGNCITLCFTNTKTRDALLNKCGAKYPHPLAQRTGKAKVGALPSDCLMLTPRNCKAGGAATTLRQVTLLYDASTHPSSTKSGVSHTKNPAPMLGFFLSRDTGKAQSWGRIPAKLYRRIQADAGANHCTLGEMVYLSTGPMGCYYAEFRSGETWWGSAVEDDMDFHTVLKEWDIYKVVFGPIVEAEDMERSTRQLVNSWIILGKDGRAAWKNIPHRLHARLEARLSSWAAISSVSLGPGGSYFCRFLDGTTDYCLPAPVAATCEYIERNGGNILDVSLHPQISNDFLIRHTELR